MVVRVFMLLGVLDLTLSVVVQVVAGRVVSSSAVLTQVGTMGPFIAGTNVFEPFMKISYVDIYYFELLWIKLLFFALKMASKRHFV